MTEARAARGGWTFVVCGVAGLVASFVLVVDLLRLLRDPDTVLACDIGPFIACGPVMTSPASSVLGVPNALIGVVAFTVILTLGVLLVSRVRLPAWVWRALAGGMVLAAVAITGMQVQSIVVIGTLCAWCMLVWAVTILLVVTVLGEALGGQDALGASGRRVGRFIARNRAVIVVLWYLAIAGAIVAVIAPF
ncbi:vitamin K epoxide reductase family protein [Agromyces atrinae]|uniref:Putative membrane protein n=1 Tax=Agromyces atrinae TaxID=592376 RepID=A0A4Q2M6S7_9MICO|nr:vitamin K epoxide reductase family protein [Agromyces atrinae]NYD67929.1 putative membrane protein [Agromyces atrinae]RXZ87905.1 vitamin K epoxide reductase [Agromyces atrinae]